MEWKGNPDHYLMSSTDLEVQRVFDALALANKACEVAREVGFCEIVVELEKQAIRVTAKK